MTFEISLEIQLATTEQSLQYYKAKDYNFNHTNLLNPLLLPTDAQNVKKRRVIKTF